MWSRWKVPERGGREGGVNRWEGQEGVNGWDGEDGVNGWMTMGRRE